MTRRVLGQAAMHTIEQALTESQQSVRIPVGLPLAYLHLAGL